MEISELIEAIKGTSPDEFKEALHKDAQGHYQAIFNAGHSTATGSAKARETELTAKVDELEKALQSKGDELTEISKKSPDVEKLKTDFEAKLIEKDERLKAIESEWKAKLDGKEKSRLRAELINELQALHVDGHAAPKWVDADVMQRIQITDDGYKAYQADGVTPYAAADGQTPLSLLAKEIVGTIPEVLIRPPKNNGSGYQGGGKGNKGSTKKRSEFSKQERIDYISENGLESYQALPM